jgi:protocatechuate 3,4-dioxygenase beta subunit
MQWAPVRLVVALALPVWLAVAQPPAKKPGRIEGTVTNSVSGAGIKKAHVYLDGNSGLPPDRIVTDATGHFAFEGVMPGRYSMQANAPGYAMPRGINGLRSQVTIGEDQEVRDVNVTLLPLGVVSGRVLDEDGEPVTGAQVKAWHYIYALGRRQLNQSGFAVTDDQGRFRMIDVLPGRYYFQAYPTPSPRTFSLNVVTDLENQIYPPLFYPGGSDLSQAAAQEVGAGEERGGIEFHLRKVPSFQVRGQVLGLESSAPLNPVFLQIFSSGMTTPSSRGLNPDGTFTIPDLTAGEYRIVAIRNDGKSVGSASDTIRVSDHDLDDLKLTIEPGITIAGSLVISGTPITQLGSLYIALEPAAREQNRPRMGGSAHVKNDGTFEFTGITPDLYVLAVLSSPSGKYLKSIQFGGQDVPDGIIDLTRKGGGSMLLTFSDDPGAVSGTTSALALVTALPVVDGALRRDQFHAATSDAAGNFHFEGLAPGKYEVMAWESADTENTQIPELRKQFSAKALQVTVAPNGKESIQLTTVPAADFAEAMRKLP